MIRPKLNEIPLSEALPFQQGAGYVTMNPDQWDELLSKAYRDGWILLEVDSSEKLVRAFRLPFQEGRTPAPKATRDPDGVET